MNYASTKTVESKTIPGVKFTIRVLTKGIKDRITTSCVGALEQLRDLRLKIQMLDLPRNDDGSFNENAEVDAEMKSRLVSIMDETARVNETIINPAYLKTMFVSVEGSLEDPFTIDGKLVKDADTLIERGPTELCEEIINVIRAEAELSTSERLNLESPTTSAAEVDGKTPVTIAEAASIKDSI